MGEERRSSGHAGVSPVLDRDGVSSGAASGNGFRGIDSVSLVVGKLALGYWNDYPVASLLAEWNLPLAILSVVLGVAGKGKGRWLLLVGAGCLVLVWITAIVHWPASTSGWIGLSFRPQSCPGANVKSGYFVNSWYLYVLDVDWSHRRFLLEDSRV